MQSENDNSGFTDMRDKKVINANFKMIALLIKKAQSHLMLNLEIKIKHWLLSVNDKNGYSIY